MEQSLHPCTTNTHNLNISTTHTHHPDISNRCDSRLTDSTAHWSPAAGHHKTSCPRFREQQQQQQQQAHGCPEWGTTLGPIFSPSPGWAAAAARPRSPAWRGATHYWCPARPRPPPPRRLNVVINQLIVSGSVVPAPGPQSRRCGGMCEVRAGGASLPASRRPARPRPPHQLQQSSVECGVSGEQHLASASTNTATASAAH